MQSSQYRSLILIAVLLASWGVLTATQPAQAAEARWPTDNAVYSLPGWAMSSATVQNPYGGQFYTVTRRYIRGSGPGVSVILKTSPSVKDIYRTGAEVGFLGAGYKVESAPPNLVPTGSRWSSLLATREAERWLVLYAYGEHRGLLGNGVVAWGFASADAILGIPNDYYSLSALVRLDDLDPAKAAAAVSVADTLFPQIAAWYAE